MKYWCFETEFKYPNSDIIWTIREYKKRYFLKENVNNKYKQISGYQIMVILDNTKILRAREYLR